MQERAARRAELIAQVGRRLEPGESLRDAGWFTRVPGRRSAGEVLRAELNPLRLAEDAAWGAVGVTAGTGPGVDWYQQARNGVLGGPPGSTAVGLDERLPEPAVAQVLAVTDRRVLVLRRSVAAPPAPTTGSGSLRERLTAAAQHVRAAWQGPGPAAREAPLEVCWQVGRDAVADAVALPAERSGRLAVRFRDGSWIVLGPSDDEETHRLVTALAR